MSAVIRKAELKDCGACVEIYNYYIEKTTVTFEETPLTVEEFEARFLRIPKNTRFLLRKNTEKRSATHILTRSIRVPHTEKRQTFRYISTKTPYQGGSARCFLTKSKKKRQHAVSKT